MLTITLFYFKNYCFKEVNKPLSRNIVTANQIIHTLEPYVTQFYGHSNYHLGEIIMTLNTELRGDVRVTYVENNNNPKIISVKLNTLDNVVETIHCLGSEDKVNPGKINFEEWRIDIDDAIKVANSFIENKKIETDSYYVRAYHNYNLDQEYWRVNLTQQRKYIDIDPYTGEIINENGF